MRSNRPDPLTQLDRSHRRLEEACNVLIDAVGARDLALLEEVQAFFRRQGRLHEEDEDRSLFPRLAQLPDTPSALLERLAVEHRAHHALGLRLDEAVSGRHDGELWDAIRAVGDELVKAYRTHIDLEETELFPLARRVLTQTDLDAMRVEMDARRDR